MNLHEEENARLAKELNEKFRREHPKEYDQMEAFARSNAGRTSMPDRFELDSDVIAQIKAVDEATAGIVNAVNRDEKARRRYALLQAAATIYVKIYRNGSDAERMTAADHAERLLAEIERREKP